MTWRDGASGAVGVRRTGCGLIVLLASLMSAPLAAQTPLPVPRPAPHDASPQPTLPMTPVEPMPNVMADEVPAYDPDNDPLRPPRLPAAPVQRMRVLLLHLAALLPADERGSAEPSGPGFRHTFGSRRFTPPEQQTLSFDPSGVDADIVLMPEVVSFRLAHKLFPSRAWRVVRAPSRSVRKGYNVAQLDGGGPAIAVRLQRGVRILGIDPALASSAVATVRLIIGGATYWLGVCDSDPAGGATGVRAPGAGHSCAGLADWARRQRAGGAHVIIGGALAGLSDVSRRDGAEGEPLALDTSAATSVPIARAERIPPRVVAGAIGIAGAGEICGRDAAGRSRLMVYPVAARDQAYRMLAWQLEVASRPRAAGDGEAAMRTAADAGRAAGDGMATRADAGAAPPTCALIAQIAP